MSNLLHTIQMAKFSTPATLVPDLKPADKDGKGKITKVSLDGKIIEDGFLPAKGQVLNKPKGNMDRR